MSEKKVVFQKEYHGFEDLYDIGRDIDECFNEDFNDLMAGIPGEFSGTMKVTIEYIEDQDEEV